MKTSSLDQELLRDELQFNELIEYFIILKSQWRIILITSLIFTFVSSSYFFRLPDTYGAKVSILIEKATRGKNEQAYFVTQVAILTSKGLIEQVTLKYNEIFN